MKASDRELTDRDYQALARFRAGLRRFLAFSEAAARAEGITPAQHQLLLAVRGHPGEGDPSISDLADALQRERHSVVGLVDRAEQHGLVASVDDELDHRRRLVELTARGAQIIEHLSVRHRAELRGFEEDLARVLTDLS